MARHGGPPGVTRATLPAFPPASWQRDARPPYSRRVFAPGFGHLDPASLPWKELRRTPEHFPEDHVAKVSSVRTVVGRTVLDEGGKPVRLYLKRSLIKGLWRRFLAPWRRSKEWRESELALALSGRGIWVPQPVFYAESALEDGTPVRYLATRALEPTWREAKAWFKAERRFDAEWRSLAAFTRRLHDLDILHGDFRSDHLFFDPTRVGIWDHLACWALIDLDGSSVGTTITASARWRALGQLTESLLTSGITEAHLKDFLAVYDHENRWRFEAEPLLKEARARQERIARK